MKHYQKLLAFLGAVCLTMTACGSPAQEVKQGSAEETKATTEATTATEATTEMEATTATEAALVSLENQRIDVPDIENARQLGGYIGADGRRVKDNLLIRTAKIDGMSEETAQKLAQTYHVNYVVDFRLDSERKAAPDQEIPGAENTWVCVFETDRSDPATMELMKQIMAAKDSIEQSIIYAKSGRYSGMYTQILLSEQGQQGYAQFFDILLNNTDGAVMWHCTNGKDRTGIAAALVLFALGVDEDVIMQDFLLTNEVFQKKIAYLQNELKNRGCEDWIVEEAQAMAGVKGEYMQAAFDAVEAEYGSMQDYIRNQLGVSDAELETLRNLYLE